MVKDIIKENKELKEKLDECYVRYTKETSRLEQRNGNLEAKLESIQSNKVAEFSDRASNAGSSDKNEYMLENDDLNNWAVCISDVLKEGETYTVTISKDKQ